MDFEKYGVYWRNKFWQKIMKQSFKIFLLLAATSLILPNCKKPSSSSKGTTFISASDSNFYYLGRVDRSKPEYVHFVHTGVSIRFSFEGSICVVHLKNRSTGKDKEGNFYKNYYTVIVDNGKPQLYSVSNDMEKIKLKGLSSGVHEVVIFKRTEALVGEGIFEGIDIEKDKKLIPVEKKSRKIEFIGNSITCGYGNEGTSKECPFSPETENAYMAYGALVSRKLNADYSAVAYSGRGMYRNYDGTTTNTMSLIYDRIYPDSIASPKWDAKKYQPDLVVVNLGTNDFAKGVPDSVIFVNTYVNFLKRLRNYYPTATILCIEGPMMNDSYPVGVKAFTKVKNYIIASKEKMKQVGDSKIYTFFLSPQEEGDYGCDWHPNIKRHEKMAEELTKEVKTLMKWN
jgi:lysophospholipase L1-like esterase